MAGSTPPSQAEELLAGVNKYCEQIPVLQKMATQFGVKPALLLMVGISVLLPFALFGIGGDTLCYIAGGVCPGYFSFKALKSKDMEKMSLLLKYWVIFITVSLVELFADFLLFWIPMYYLLKLAATYWLLAERFRGANTVYDKLAIWLEKVEPNVDEMFDSVSGALKKGVSSISTSKAE